MFLKEFSRQKGRQTIEEREVQTGIYFDTPCLSFLIKTKVRLKKKSLSNKVPVSLLTFPPSFLRSQPFLLCCSIVRFLSKKEILIKPLPIKWQRVIKHVERFIEGCQSGRLIPLLDIVMMMQIAALLKCLLICLKLSQVPQKSKNSYQTIP